MEITSLKCNNCSANLDINPKIKFFTCTFCGSSLTIKKTGNVMFTEVLEEIKDDTETLINHSEVMLVEKEIDRLDREWLMEREQYKIHGKHGSHLPDDSKSEGGQQLISIIGGVFFFVIFVFIMAQASSMGAGTPVFFFALIFIVFMGAIIMANSNKKSEYQTAKKKYEEHRSKLIAELNEKKQHIENENTN